MAFGLSTAPPGLFLRHGLGPHFGLGEVNRRVALGTLGALLAVVLVEVLASSVE